MGHVSAMGGAARALTMPLTILFLFFAVPALSTVVSIDFGTEFVKVAMIKPGSKIDIVLNERSSRKWPALVGFSRGERAFAESAAIWGTRYPKTVFGNMKQLLGKPYSSDVEQRFSAIYMPYKLVPVKERGVVGLEAEDGTVTLPEELVAQILEYSREAAVEHGQAKVRDCVITVPTFFTASMRQALLDAAELAGWNVLSLINDGTAVAVQYGMDKNYDIAPFNGTMEGTVPAVVPSADSAASKASSGGGTPGPYRMLLYDMGYSYTQLTLVAYYRAQVKDGARRNKTVGQIRVVASDWDASLGGSNFDGTLIEMFADFIDANKPGGKPDGGIRAHPKAMSKLRKEANRVKKVLSANTETFASIEGVIDEYNFKMPVKRKDFEDGCAALFERAVAPVKRLLADAGLEPKDINAVEVFGGPVRIPKIQTELAAVFGREDVDKHINGDEGAVVGAAFFAANQSTAFRVRQLGVVDVLPYGITVTVQTLDDSFEQAEATEVEAAAAATDATESDHLAKAAFESSNAKLDGTDAAKDPNHVVEIFPKGIQLGSKKKVSFPTRKNFAVTVAYSVPSALPSGADPTIMQFNVTGVRKAASPFNHTGGKSVRASMSFLLDASSLVSLVKRDLVVEETVTETVKVPIKKNKTEAVGNKSKDSSDKADEPAAGDASDAPKTEDSASKPAEEAASSSSDTADTASNETNTSSESDAGQDAASSEDNTVKEEPPKPAEPEFELLNKTKKKFQKVPLTVSFDHSKKVVKPLDGDLYTSVKGPLDAFRKAAEEKKAKDAARNSLEALVYSVKEKLDEDADPPSEFSAHATPEELESLKGNASTLGEWVEEADDDVPLTEFTSRLSLLQGLVDPVSKRAEQSERRPKAVKSAQEVIEQVRNLVANWTAAMPNASELSVNETADMEARVAKLESWLTNQTEVQETLKKYEEPAFTDGQVYRKMNAIIDEMQRFSRRRPKPKPIKVTATNTTKDDNSTNATVNVTSEGSGSGEQAPDGEQASDGSASGSDSDASEGSGSSSSADGQEGSGKAEGDAAADEL